MAAEDLNRDTDRRYTVLQRSMPKMSTVFSPKMSTAEYMLLLGTSTS